MSGFNLYSWLDPSIEFEPEMEFMIKPGFIARSGFDCSVEERYYKIEKCGSLPSQTSGVWQCSSDSCELQCQPGFESTITLKIACECDVSTTNLCTFSLINIIIHRILLGTGMQACQSAAGMDRQLSKVQLPPQL